AHRGLIVYGCARQVLITRRWDNGLCPSASTFQSRFARASAATATLPPASSRASACRATWTAYAAILPALRRWRQPREPASSPRGILSILSAAHPAFLIPSSLSRPSLHCAATFVCCRAQKSQSNALPAL